jgi:hypothetical protein
MKHQYFGDTRDLFKYDLILRIMKGMPSIRSFTFIPMLTPGDGSTQGNRTEHGKAKAGFRNQLLGDYLATCIREKRRNVCEILPFFTAQKIPVNFHGEAFTAGDRAAYFRAIPCGWLRDALVFLDPDIGMEVAHPTEKHLLFSEIGGLFHHMGDDSVLMIFQYFPRVVRQNYLEKRARELEEITPERVHSLSDNQVAFFFLGRDAGVTKKLREILVRYHEDYPDLTLSVSRNPEGSSGLHKPTG